MARPLGLQTKKYSTAIHQKSAHTTRKKSGQFIPCVPVALRWEWRRQDDHDCHSQYNCILTVNIRGSTQLDVEVWDPSDKGDPHGQEDVVPYLAGEMRGNSGRTRPGEKVEGHGEEKLVSSTLCSNFGKPAD
ncbi:uncharacterized protein ACWYII_048472 isoform 1-T1 [Salvelinus alpinus]